jgi:hypothetical protein
MPILRFCAWLESTQMAAAIRESTWLFPTIETLHVLSILVVVGSITMFDLRLLNLASRDRSVTEVYEEIMPWARTSFISAVIFGGLMFSSSATKYYHNFPFRMKMLMLLIAGLNVAIFEFWTFRSVEKWNREARIPLAAKLAGGLSLVLWIFIVGFGRWIGFTK